MRQKTKFWLKNRMEFLVTIFVALCWTSLVGAVHVSVSASNQPVRVAGQVDLAWQQGNQPPQPVIHRRIPGSRGQGGGAHVDMSGQHEHMSPNPGVHRERPGGHGHSHGPVGVHVDMPGQHGNRSPHPVVHRDGHGDQSGHHHPHGKGGTHVDLPGQHGNRSPHPVIHREGPKGHGPHRDPHHGEGGTHVDLPGQHGNRSPHPVIHREGPKGHGPHRDPHHGEGGAHVDLQGPHGNRSPHPVVHREGPHGSHIQPHHVGAQLPGQHVNIQRKLPGAMHIVPTPVVPIDHRIGQRRPGHIAIVPHSPVGHPVIHEPIPTPEVYEPIPKPEIVAPIAKPEHVVPIAKPEIQKPVAKPEIHAPVGKPVAKPEVHNGIGFQPVLIAGRPLGLHRGGNLMFGGIRRPVNPFNPFFRPGLPFVHISRHNPGFIPHHVGRPIRMGPGFGRPRFGRPRHLHRQGGQTQQTQDTVRTIGQAAVVGTLLGAITRLLGG